MSNRTAFAIAAVLVIVGATSTKYLLRNGFDRQQPSQSSLVSQQDTCGPKCLWIATRRLGMPLDWGSVSHYFFEPTARGTTLSELGRAATRFGATGSIEKSGWDALREWDGVAILFVNEGHFIVVDPREHAPPDRRVAGAVRAYDPSHIPVWLDQRELEAIWKGDTLLLSRVATSRRDGPQLYLDTCYEDVALVGGALEVSFHFPLRNVGTDLLNIEVAGTTCHCASAELSATAIAPGGRAELTCVVDVRNAEGVFSQVVVVDTNDPKVPSVSFTLRGAVPRKRLVSTREAFIGSLAPGDEAIHHIAVYDPGDDSLEVSDAKVVPSKAIQNSSVQPTCDVACCSYEKADPQVRQDLSLSRGDMLLEFSVRVPPGCRHGAFEFDCQLETNLPDMRSIGVKIRGEVLHDLVAVPEALVVSMLPGMQEERTAVVIRARSDEPVVVQSSTVEAPFPVRVLSAHVRNNASVVTFSFPSPDTRDISHYDGAVLCKTASGETVRVPFVVFLEE